VNGKILPNRQRSGRKVAASRESKPHLVGPQLPADNQLLKGAGAPSSDAADVLFGVSSFAERFGVVLGDRIWLSGGSEAFLKPVTSIRQLETGKSPFQSQLPGWVPPACWPQVSGHFL